MGLFSYLFGATAEAPPVYPVDDSGNAVDVGPPLCAALEAQIAKFESGEDTKPPSLALLEIEHCRIGAAEFAAVKAFESANPSFYAGSAAAKPPPPPVAHEDGTMRERMTVFAPLMMAQLYARWYAIQKGMQVPESTPPWPPATVRFGVGDRVQCMVAPGCFAAGVVVRAGRCAYLELKWSQPMPYQVQLDASEVDELIKVKILPDGHPGLICAPADVDHVIRAARN
jgi:hypothetical protein